MSVNFGTNNASRYYSCPDHADFTLTGDHTWLMVMAPFTSEQTNPKYFLSTGGFEAANSANIYVTSAAGTIAYALNGGAVQTGNVMPSEEFALCWARRVSDAVRCGEINLTSQTARISDTVTRSTVSNGGNLFVGARSDLNAQRYGQGRISWLALLNVGLATEDIVDLAAGTKVLMDDFGSSVVELWDMSEASATITGKKAGHVLTRNGTDYLSDGPDPLPYQSAQEEITFSGTIPQQNGNADSAFSLDLSPYFSGSATPFSYAIQSGALPSGLSISGNLITGTPTNEETETGIVVRGTDANLDTADSNAFDIVIGPAISVTKGVKITLNVRATLQPVGALSDIVVRWWDSPIQSGAPVFESGIESTDASGQLEIDLDGITSLPLSGYGYLVMYRQGGTPEQDLHFAGRVQITDIS